MPDDTKPEETEKPKRFAAYDTNYLRFVGGVHDTKAKATKAAKDLEVKDFEIREV